MSLFTEAWPPRRPKTRLRRPRRQPRRAKEFRINVSLEASQDLLASVGVVGSKFPDYRYVATLLRCAPEQLREVPPETYKVWREMHPVCGHRSDWWSQGSDWWSQNSARSSADTSQERSSAPTEQLSSENMLVGMMSTVVENRQGAVSRAASYRCMYTCMMYVYVSQLNN